MTINDSDIYKAPKNNKTKKEPKEYKPKITYRFILEDKTYVFEAYTKGEARAMLKKELKVKKLPELK